MTTWKLPCKEILISINSKGDVSLIPVDMSGETHHSTCPAPRGSIDCILVYYGAVTSHLENGNVCIRGNRLIIDVEIVVGRLKCLVVKVNETSGDE